MVELSASRIERLRGIAARHRRIMQAHLSAYDCGLTLALYLSPELVEARNAYISAMLTLVRIDPSMPEPVKYALSNEVTASPYTLVSMP